MRFARLDHYLTGVSVPVAALRTAQGCGVGEFLDLPVLGDWCAQAGLEVVQLLPVNDTGANSSPYSALSAFALHPLYLRLQSLPGAKQYLDKIGAFQAGSAGRFNHRDVLSFKLSIARQIFSDSLAGLRKDQGFASWRALNPWITAYCVFSALKAGNQDAPWASWEDLANPSTESIAAWWEANTDQCLFFAWIQKQLEEQLLLASRGLQEKGVQLKGDIPILMSRESADVWAERQLFDLAARAGAPPDMFSPSGQNWGFPVYDWDRLAADDYRWWKGRLTQAGKFFHAVRIDHVLGFFRIWKIPAQEASGLLGHFSPSAGLSVSDLRSLGFDDGKIRWLTLPHVAGQELAGALAGDGPRVARAYLSRIGSEDLYNIPGPLDSETAIQVLDEPVRVKDFLLSRHADRVFLLDGKGVRYPQWYFEGTKGFRGLSDQEKSSLRDLLRRRRRESEKIWERRGRELLAMLRDTTDMLVCAEDLGDVPDCVPRVLADLNIFGLRILRWSREYKKAAPGAPARFIPPSEYPKLSVCTPSVHDTSTLRGWWEEDPVERETYYRSLGETRPCPPRMTNDLQERIVSQCLGAGSLLCMFQVQDILDLDPALWSPDPRADRINVPGTVNDQNWTWRMPLDLAALAGRERLTAKVRALVDGRKARKLDGGAR